MEWRRVQVWLPRVSTSGGQSGGRVGVVVEGGEEEGEDEGPVLCFIIASQSEEEVQVRQLEGMR